MRLSGPREWDLHLSADGSAAWTEPAPPTPERGGGQGGGVFLVLHALLTVLPSQVRAARRLEKKKYLQKLERKLLLIRTRTVCRVVGSGALKQAPKILLSLEGF